MKKKHSVLLKEEECEGCTNCVKNCPTKAIRVHQGKATIKEELCIDCAECIRTCEYHAKYTKTDSLQDIKDCSYPVVLVPPSFYGQFAGDVNPVHVAAALHRLGFKEVHDVALAAEKLSRMTADFLWENKGSYISSSCPVVVRLIKKMYPELLENLMPLKSPVDLMAQRVRRELNERNIDKKEAGMYFLTPCPAKLTAISYPPGLNDSSLDSAIAVNEIYTEVLKIISNIKEEDENLNQYKPPYLGFGWGQSGGEIDILHDKKETKTLSISGIHNVKSILEELVRNNIKGIKYFEMTACPGGCVGGVLNAINPFQAKFNLQSIMSRNSELVNQDYLDYDSCLDYFFKAEDVVKLDEDIVKAMEKLMELEREIEILPGLDCAACGAPDCKTLAEDIVNGLAQRTDCIFMLRQEIEELAAKISSLTSELPPVMADGKKKNEEEKAADKEKDINKGGDTDDS